MVRRYTRDPPNALRSIADELAVHGTRIVSYDATKHDQSIRSWIVAPNDVFHVCGKLGTVLTRDMITKWVRRPAKGYTLTLRGVDGRPRATPIAFATLSQCEANLPTDTVEVGHLLVAPTHRHHGWGQHLVAALSRSALQRGFHRIVARVERSNVAGAALILQPSLRFREMDPAAVPWDPEQRTRWFERRQ